MGKIIWTTIMETIKGPSRAYKFCMVNRTEFLTLHVSLALCCFYRVLQGGVFKMGLERKE